MENQENRTCWWWWVLFLVGLPLALLLFWWLRRMTEQEEVAPVRIELTPALDADVAGPRERPAPAEPDNLRRIEGIGPKFSQLLQQAGIQTFAQLAAADVDRLTQVLKDAGAPFADPTTWPEQAALAAEERWDALQALQDELQGGRRV